MKHLISIIVENKDKIENMNTGKWKKIGNGGSSPSPPKILNLNSLSDSDTKFYETSQYKF